METPRVSPTARVPEHLWATDPHAKHGWMTRWVRKSLGATPDRSCMSPGPSLIRYRAVLEVRRMRNTLGAIIGALMAMGCVAEGEAPDDPTSSVETSSNASSVEEEACEPGFRIGRCPTDFALPDGAGDLVSLYEQRGNRVAVIGSAEY
jgi:hypothetical protein